MELNDYNLLRKNKRLSNNLNLLYLLTRVNNKQQYILISLERESLFLFSLVLEHLMFESSFLLEFNHQLTLVLWGLCLYHVVVVASKNSIESHM